MDKLPEVLLQEILSRLDDSADVARCRIAWKGFNNVYSHLRSINLKCDLRMYFKSRRKVLKSSKLYTTFKSAFRNAYMCLNPSSKVTQHYYKSIFLDLISNMEIVESVCISLEGETEHMLDKYLVAGSADDNLHFTDDAFVITWLPRVSKHLKSLSISSLFRFEHSNVLRLVSLYCHNLVELKVARAWLSMSNLNPMPVLTSLTLESINYGDRNLATFIKFFPNLQVLKLLDISGVDTHPVIHLLNLKTCHLSISTFSDVPYSMSLITPNLVTLRFESTRSIEFTVEAPMLSHLHLLLVHPNESLVIKSKNLKTVWINSKQLGTLLDTFHHRSVNKLTLDSSRIWTNLIDFSYVLYNGFRVFPKMRSLCMQPSVWSELEACGKWDMPYAMTKRLKTFTAYLSLGDPSLTFSCVACVLEKCVRLSVVSFLIHRKVSDKVSKRFMSKCMGHWPHLEWRCGNWIEGMEDSWTSI